MKTAEDAIKIISKRMKDLGWSNYELAKQCRLHAEKNNEPAISQATVYNFCDGKSVNIGLVAFFTICEVLGIEIQAIGKKK